MELRWSESPSLSRRKRCLVLFGDCIQSQLRGREFAIISCRIVDWALVALGRASRNCEELRWSATTKEMRSQRLSVLLL